MTCLAWVHFILSTKENPNNFPNLFILGWRMGAFENKVCGGGKVFSLVCTQTSKYVWRKKEAQPRLKLPFPKPGTRGSVHSARHELRVRSLLRTPGPTSCV